MVVVSLVGRVDPVRTVETVGQGTAETTLGRFRDASVEITCPLHRRPHRQAAWNIEVFGRPDLFAVEQDRNPRE
jgi:hypothetical protein